MKYTIQIDFDSERELTNFVNTKLEVDSTRTPEEETFSRTKIIYETVEERRQGILRSLPLEKPNLDKPALFLGEEPGTPAWIRKNLGISKSKVQHDLVYLLNNVSEVERVSIKALNKGKWLTNTYIYYKNSGIQKFSLWDQYVNEFGTERDLNEVISKVITLLPYDNPYDIKHSEKKVFFGKQMLLNDMRKTLTQYLINKESFFNLIDTLVSLGVLKKVKAKGNYFYFYINPHYHQTKKSFKTIFGG